MTNMTFDTTTIQSDRSNPMMTRATTLFDVIAALQDQVTDATDSCITETVMRLCQKGCLKWQGPFQAY